MRAFDTDIATEILQGNAVYVARAALIPVEEQALPIVVAEEVLRGRLHGIRQAEAGKSRFNVEQAYRLFEHALLDLRQVAILPMTAQADALVGEWRKAKIKGSTHDLRIAAICVSHRATLITRNRRDFERVPGLSVEFWE